MVAVEVFDIVLVVVRLCEVVILFFVLVMIFCGMVVSISRVLVLLCGEFVSLFVVFLF